MSCELTNIEDKYSDIEANLLGVNNDISLSTGYDAINNSIANILTVKRFEVPSRPQEFIDLYGYLHEIADEITYEALRMEVKDALARFETRIEVVEVQINEFVTSNYITLEVLYQLRRSVDNSTQRTNITIRG